MGRASSRRRRMATIKALTERVPGVDADLAAHMYDKQIVPQERAATLRKQGVDVDAAFANTSPDAQGHKVRCYGCGKRATLAFKPPGGQGLLCPDCQRGM